ncbi:MAG: response regulator [Phycisphaerales bacterium]|nr:response regulator [Phycisphaerales bacterium]
MVQHPGGTTAKLLVVSRDLSSTGMAFYHRGFLHAGTACELELLTLAGEMELIRSKVVRCRHIKSSIHEIGIAFDAPIDPRRFMEVGIEHAAINAEPMEMPELTGRVLQIDDQKLEALLLKHHLKATGIKLTSIQNPDEVSHLIKAQAFDLIVCDLNMGDVKGEDVIERLRAEDFKGPIIAITSETNPTRLDHVKQAGATNILSKPYDPASLIGMLSSLLKSVSAGATDEPIYSSIPAEGDMGELLTAHIEEAKKKAQQIEQAMADDALDALRGLCLDVKASGSSCGYPVLTEAADAVVHALDSSQSVVKSANEIRSLLSVCSRLRLAEPDESDCESEGQDEAA